MGADQTPHVELAREIARRFNHLYGSEEDFAANAEAAIRKLGKKTGKLYTELRLAHTRHGDTDALATAQALIREQNKLTLSDKERLLGYLEGDSVAILPEPQHVLAEQAAKMPGLDGRKMSNTQRPVLYGSSIRFTPKGLNSSKCTISAAVLAGAALNVNNALLTRSLLNKHRSDNGAGTSKRTLTWCTASSLKVQSVLGMLPGQR